MRTPAAASAFLARAGRLLPALAVLAPVGRGTTLPRSLRVAQLALGTLLAELLARLPARLPVELPAELLAGLLALRGAAQLPTQLLLVAPGLELQLFLVLSLQARVRLQPRARSLLLRASVHRVTLNQPQLGQTFVIDS